MLKSGQELLTRLEPGCDSEIQINWRLAQASYFFASRQFEEGSDEQKQWFTRGLGFARATGDRCWQGQKYIAIMLGLLQNFDSTSEKIEKGKLYKIHITNAIRLNPRDAVTRYLHGRW